MDDQTSDIISARPDSFEERYRLYLDESGDHVFRSTKEIPHRYLCLLGCWFKNPDYLNFHQALETLKIDFFHHHPDNPVILHREDILNKRGAFKVLQDNRIRSEFDSMLLNVVKKATFKVVAVVIDKATLRNSYGESAPHPYHLGLGFLLQRYAGYLNFVNRVGDIMAEARGANEDQLLNDSYKRVLMHGIWGYTPAAFFMSALSSKENQI